MVAGTGRGDADCVVVCQRSSNGTGVIIAGLRRWLVADDPYRSDRTGDQTGWGMIRCLIFACVEQDPQRSNAAQAACGYRVLQREHQL